MSRRRQPAPIEHHAAGNRTGDRTGQILRDIYTRLWSTYGPQHWWPGDTATEIVVGAILTQNTVWRNVERAIENLKRARCLTWRALRAASRHELAAMIRPSGTYLVKAARLRAFVDYLWDQSSGSLRSLLSGDLEQARRRLLSIHGIGPETADSILLYAGKRPTFVVDAYTRRVLCRHFVIDRGTKYEEVRQLFHRALPVDVQLFNEYHALLVAVGKRHCHPRAVCASCPLEDLPHRKKAPG